MTRAPPCARCGDCTFPSPAWAHRALTSSPRPRPVTPAHRGPLLPELRTSFPAALHPLAPQGPPRSARTRASSDCPLVDVPQSPLPTTGSHHPDSPQTEPHQPRNVCNTRAPTSQLPLALGLLSLASTHPASHLPFNGNAFLKVITQDKGLPWGSWGICGPCSPNLTSQPRLC